MPMFTMDDLNQMDTQTLTDTLGSIFEHSSWIAERSAKTTAVFVAF